jgi:hypothetical protein
MALFAENTNVLKMLRVGPWIKDCVLLIDLGFYRCQIFTRIKENGGYFVSRLKRNANPLFIEAIGSIAAEVSPYVESTSKSSLRI